jgi:hypothetical protein
MFCGCNAHPQTAKRHEPKTSQSLELTMPVVTVNSAEQFYDLFETDKQVVLQVSSMAPHQEIVQSWQNDLHRLRPYLEERLPELAGKKLNVVLQFHGWQGQIEKCAIDSQKNVATKLEEQKPRLLITEGTYFDRFSKDGLLNNIELDHPEYFGTLDKVIDAFQHFVNQLDPSGLLITIMLYSLVIFSMILGRKIASGKWKLSVDMLYFFFIFSVIAPIWLMKAVYNTLLVKKPAWR